MSKILFNRIMSMPVITLTEKQFKKACMDLQKVVVSSEFSPDLYVSIATGGDYVLDEFDLSPKINVQSIKKQRASTKIKNRLSWLFSIKLVLPYFILNTLRRLEHYFRIRKYVPRASSLENIMNQFRYKKIDRDVSNILIVDDAVDSGETLIVVKKILKEVYPHAKLKTAVIVTTTYKPFCKPDYSLFNQTLIRFPWSKDMKNAK